MHTTILLFMKHDTVRDLFEAELKQRGFSVLTNATLHETLGCIRTFDFDIVLFDPYFYSYDGLAFLTEVKRCSTKKKIQFFAYAPLPSLKTLMRMIRLELDVFFLSLCLLILFVRKLNCLPLRSKTTQSGLFPDCVFVYGNIF